MKVKVIKSGLLSTIQDLGRFGYRDLGVPVCGAMDTNSAQLSNRLLNNNKDDAVLEMTMIGPKLQFDMHSQIAITGADMSPMLNGEAIKNNKVYNIKQEDILEFGSIKSGLRAYLAIKGGFITDSILGSRSYYMPMTSANTIKGDDFLPAISFNNDLERTISFSKLKTIDFFSKTLNVFKGPEFDSLNQYQKEKIISSEFEVSNLYSRMAYQLSPLIENDLQSILTGPVLPGTVQLTPSGRLIVLMRDCQTTGGYPRVLQLAEDAINLLSQKKERDKVNFRIAEL
ncbi:MAG: biotin-dependent carboxyltransferase family protein [Winogradskyella sp.]|nr:MAG: biotin-dependent carboxyltransferase family protein [Winogradskyella sp.]